MYIILMVDLSFFLHFVVKSKLVPKNPSTSRSIGCMCCSSCLDALLPYGSFLLDADRGNFSLLLRCEGVQFRWKNGYLSLFFPGVSFLKFLSTIKRKFNLSDIFYYAFMVSISLIIASAKDGIHSFVSEK